MESIVPAGTDRQDRNQWAVCPTCGMTTSDAVVVFGSAHAVGTYVCEDGHLFQVWWKPEVSA